MQNRSSGASGLVFGGIMAALVIIFAIVPFLSIFLPIPLVLAYVRYGGRVATLTAAVAVLFSVIFVGPIQAVTYMIPSGVLPGLVFGYGFRNGLKPFLIGLIAIAVFMFGFAGTYVITRVALFGGRDPIAVSAESPEGKQLLNSALDFVETLTVEPPNATPTQKAQFAMARAQIEEIRRDPVGVTWVLLPVSLFMLGAFSTWLNYMLSRWILPRFGHSIPAPTPFAELRVPAWLTWVFLAAMIGQGYMGSSLLAGPWWVKVALNVVSALLYIFVLVGVAVAFGWMRKKEISKPMAIAILVGVPLLPGGAGIQIYVLLAMIDTIFDFRGLGHGLWKPSEDTP